MYKKPQLVKQNVENKKYIRELSVNLRDIHVYVFFLSFEWDVGDVSVFIFREIHV